MPVTPKLIRDVGRMLHGEQFVAALARDLDMNPRNVQRLIAGERPIPEGLGRDLLALLDARRNEIAREFGLADGSQHRAP